jgi:hypothetical protein
VWVNGIRVEQIDGLSSHGSPDSSPMGSTGQAKHRAQTGTSHEDVKNYRRLTNDSAPVPFPLRAT